jgi:hypothetical protein
MVPFVTEVQILPWVLGSAREHRPPAVDRIRIIRNAPGALGVIGWFLAVWGWKIFRRVVEIGERRRSVSVRLGGAIDAAM